MKHKKVDLAPQKENLWLSKLMRQDGDCQVENPSATQTHVTQLFPVLVFKCFLFVCSPSLCISIPINPLSFFFILSPSSINQFVPHPQHICLDTSFSHQTPLFVWFHSTATPQASLTLQNNKCKSFLQESGSVQI